MKKIFTVSFVLFLALSAFSTSLRAQETQNIKIMIAGINNYKDYAEIKKALFKVEGLQVSYDTATPGLQTFKGSFEGDADALVSTLTTDLPSGHSVKKKLLPSQMVEITILPQ